ncbi:MAG: Gfo/Idh/MocA family oxidoreductase [Planctomycetes bacterium]|nr:Gfo/Idh/MocA family oxidoreductase [Planctomycetota bacterium]
MMTTRREFLQQTAATGAAFSAAYVWTNRQARAQGAATELRIGAIGVGGSRGAFNRGGVVARGAAQFGQLVAVCDVDDLHAAEFNQEFDGKLSTYRDYREMLQKEKPDIVTIGTPDHWHVAIAIAALRAGCDVYCEKPLTLTIDEGIEIEKVVKETGQVFQVGTQQRSENDQDFLKAIAIVQSGRLGKNVNAHMAIGKSKAGGPFSTVPTPDDLDWDMWLGPAPKVDYCPERQRKFRWFFDYSGGKMTDWGAHHLDIAQWALGFEHSGPVKVSGTANFTPLVPDHFDWHAYLDGEAKMPNAFNTPAGFDVKLEYVNGSFISMSDHFQREGGTDFGNGILFEGEEGRIFVNRGRLSGKPVDDLTETDQQEIQGRVVELYKGKEPGRSGGHMGNFFECVKDRTEPVSDVATHHRTMTSCHLSNIALMLGRELNWDPDKQQFVNDPEAEAFRTRRRRGGYSLA